MALPPKNYAEMSDEELLEYMGRKPASTGGPVSPELAKQMQAAYAGNLAGNAAVSGALTGAQVALAAIPTSQDLRNRQKIGELEKMERDGQLGQLSADEESGFNAAMGGVGTMAREAAMRSEQRAAMAGTTSAAAALRPEREARRDVQQAGMRVGLERTQAKLKRAGERLQELESRTAYESERMKNLMSTGSQAIGQIGGIAGQVAGAQAVKQIDVEKLLAGSPGMDAEDLTNLLAIYGGPRAEVLAQAARVYGARG